MKSWEKNRGFTLIETITAIAVFALIMAAISVFVITLYRSNTFAFQQSFAIENARRGISEMVQYLREADYSAEGSFPLISASTSSLAFYSDIDRDYGVEKVRYFLDGTDLKQGVVEPTGNPPGYTGTEVIRTVAQHVRNIADGAPMFVYYDDNGDEITDTSKLASITFVDVKIMVNVDPIHAPKEFELFSSADLRNLKTNL